MLLNILLVILVIDCVALVGVVLLQRSEGGALGMGGGPTGMFTARGAGDLLTRTTWILATVFFVLAFLITMWSSFERLNASVVNRIDPNDLQVTPQAPPPAGGPGEAPAQSGAPPLPNAAPPLPGTAPAPATAAPPLPQSAPRPTAAPRPAAQRPAAQRPAAQPQSAPPPVVRTQPASPAPTAAPPPASTPATTTPTPNP